MTQERFYDCCIHLINELHKEALRYQGQNNWTCIMSITLEEYCDFKNLLRNNLCICKDWEKFFKVVKSVD